MAHLCKNLDPDGQSMVVTFTVIISVLASGWEVTKKLNTVQYEDQWARCLIGRSLRLICSLRAEFAESSPSQAGEGKSTVSCVLCSFHLFASTETLIRQLLP